MSRLCWISIFMLALIGTVSAKPAARHSNLLGLPKLPKLVTTFQSDPPLCAKIRTLERAFRGCDMAHQRCFEPEVSTQFISVVPAKEIAINQYGYTKVFVSMPTGKPYAIVFLDRFNGDRHPRYIETWRVNAAEFLELTNLEPRPLAYESWVKGGHGIERETHAAEFATLLSRGEKLSEDSSPVWMPVLRIGDDDYSLSRECAGFWGYGEYLCNVVIKVKVKRIGANTKSVTVCEYAKSGGP